MFEINIEMRDVDAAMKANAVVSFAIKHETLLRMVAERDLIIQGLEHALNEANKDRPDSP